VGLVFSEDEELAGIEGGVFRKGVGKAVGKEPAGEGGCCVACVVEFDELDFLGLVRGSVVDFVNDDLGSSRCSG
jgi:hypothetical protein